MTWFIIDRFKIAKSKKAITHGNSMNLNIPPSCTFEYVDLTIYQHACVFNKPCQMSCDDKQPTAKGSTFLSLKGHN